MGMAASQVRLLSLTSRQHSVEYQAQYLQAQKLRLANDSDTVYNTYIEALDATALKTRQYDAAGTANWIDGSLNNLMRYGANESTTGTTFYAQDISDGKLYVPKTVSDNYSKCNNDLETFLTLSNVKYSMGETNSDRIEKQTTYNSDITNGYNTPSIGVDNLNKYNILKGTISTPAETSTYNAANSISSLISTGKLASDNDEYIYTNNNYLTLLQNNLTEIKGTGYYTNGDSNTKSIIDYCLSYSGFTPETNLTSLTANTADNTNYISYTKSSTDTTTNYTLSDASKLELLINGGTYNEAYTQDAYTDEEGYYHDATAATSTSNVYDSATQTAINSYTGNTTSTNSNIATALLKLTSSIETTEHNNQVTVAQEALGNFLSPLGVSESTAEGELVNYNTYLTDKSNLDNSSSVIGRIYDDNVQGNYYEQLFNAIKAAGGCKEISDTNAKSSTWVNNMIKNGQVVLATYNNTSNELDNTTASSNGGIEEVSDDDAVTVADNNYETDLDAIKSKETKYDTKLTQIEAERDSIKTEIDSLKQIIKDNTTRTFKTFT